MPKDTETSTTLPTNIGLPFMAGLIEFWMMPITLMAQFTGFASPVVEDEPEIDRKLEHNQLPVPNALRKDMDHDLFA